MFVFYGFSHTVGAALLHFKPPPPKILYFHVALSSLWLIIFVTQTALVGAKFSRLHRGLGPFGMLVGVAVIWIGLATVIIMRQRAIAEQGENIGDIAFLSIPLFGSLTSFAVPSLAAAILRNRPGWHRPLMLIAATSMTIAAQVRISWIAESPFPLLIPLITLGLILSAAAYDLFSQGRVSPGWLAGIPGVIAMQCLAVYLVAAAPKPWVAIATFRLQTF